MANETQALNLKEATRKLASVQEVKELTPIPGADRIEVATINGWKTVVKKGEFKPGDLGIYFEIDSFLPIHEAYAFVGDPKINPITAGTKDEKSGYRLRTVKLRKQVSQGLFMPLDKVPNTTGMPKENFDKFISRLTLGRDVTEILGVTKWEVPEVTGDLGVSKGGFPLEFTNKTDEDRIQNNPKAFFDLEGKDFFITQKIDGTSTTIVAPNREDQPEFMFASRNLRLGEGNKIEEIANEMGILDKIRELNLDVPIVLQSELHGPGIQSNRLGLDSPRLSTFNISVDGVRLGLVGMLKYAKLLNLNLPRIEVVGASEETINLVRSLIDEANEGRADEDKIILAGAVSEGFKLTADELLEFADDLKYDNGFPQEGIVIRAMEDLDAFDPISFKAISNKFLLKTK